MATKNDADIIIGRGNAAVDPRPKNEEGGKSGHPLPSNEKARHGSVPERLEKRKGHGAN